MYSDDCNQTDLESCNQNQNTSRGNKQFSSHYIFSVEVHIEINVRETKAWHGQTPPRRQACSI